VRHDFKKTKIFENFFLTRNPFQISRQNVQNSRAPLPQTHLQSCFADVTRVVLSRPAHPHDLFGLHERDGMGVLKFRKRRTEGQTRGPQICARVVQRLRAAEVQVGRIRTASLKELVRLHFVNKVLGSGCHISPLSNIQFPSAVVLALV